MFLFPFIFALLCIYVCVCNCNVSFEYKREEVCRLSDNAMTMRALNLLFDILHPVCQPNPEMCFSYLKRLYTNEGPISMNPLRHNG